MFGRRPLEARHAAVEAGADDGADIQAAYERGRQDERAARRRHPLLMTLTFIIALAGLAILVVAAYEGSFARGGVVVDRNLNIAADRAEPVVRGAAADAGQAVKDAGRSIKDKTHEATK
ncbi:hypothetical protein [Phenylobacterium sp.]|uniref:hypothetical protein n=1 Tax=Phenylobacterium sp. TaxID=1871053 RepID=UPI002F40D353